MDSQTCCLGLMFHKNTCGFPRILYLSDYLVALLILHYCLLPILNPHLSVHIVAFIYPYVPSPLSSSMPWCYSSCSQRSVILSSTTWPALSWLMTWMWWMTPVSSSEGQNFYNPETLIASVLLLPVLGYKILFNEINSFFYKHSLLSCWVSGIITLDPPHLTETDDLSLHTWW